MISRRAFRSAIALAACLLCPAAAAAQGKDLDTFVYAVTGDLDSLDPDWAFDAISQEVQYQIYETLVFFKGSATDVFEPKISAVVPSRANGLISKDGLTYSFPIRKNVRFHDGSLLTVEDVRYSLMRFLLTDRSSGPSFLLLGPLLGMDSVKPEASVFELAQGAILVKGDAIQLKLKRPYAPLLSILASYAPVFSKKWVVERGGWDGTFETWARFHDPLKQQGPLYDKEIGTGPFKLERWDQQEKKVILARNEEYWAAPAKLKRLVFKTVPEPATRKLMLQAGDADAAMMERQYLPQVQGLEGVAVSDDLPFLETHNAFVMTFKINPEANPYIGSGRLDGDGIPADFFSDVHVRRALAHAFDYDAYIRDGYRGKGERARGPLPKGVFGYNPKQPLHAFDLAAAAAEFKAAFGGRAWEKGFRFSLVYSQGFSDRQLACQIMKKNVEALNPKFRVDIIGVQQSTWLSQYSAKKLPMSNARWHMDYPDPDDTAFAFLHSGGYYAANSVYSNPEADKLVEAARGELDADKRRGLYYKLQAIAHDDVPQIYTLDTYFFQVRKSSVKGWYYNPIVLYGFFHPVSK